MSDNHFLNEQFFKDDQNWLILQPDMKKWPKCLDDLRSVLVGCIYKTILKVCSPELHPESREMTSGITEMHRDCAHRVWGSLRYHWKLAIEDNQGVHDSRDGESLAQHSPDIAAVPCNQVQVSRVVESLAQHRDVSNGRDLGGNPLEDVILAVAVSMGDNTAVQTFMTRFAPLARRIVREYHLERSSETSFAGDAIPDLLIEFCGDAFMNPNTLGSYRGEAALAGWLPLGLRRRALKKVSRKKGVVIDSIDILPEPIGADAKSSDVSEVTDCRQLIMRLLAQAAKALAADDVHVLRDRCDGVQNQQTASRLGIEPGNVTRRRLNAIAQLRSAMKSEGHELQDCAETVLGPMGEDSFIPFFVQLLSDGNNPHRTDDAEIIAPEIEREAGRSRKGDGEHGT